MTATITSNATCCRGRNFSSIHLPVGSSCGASSSEAVGGPATSHLVPQCPRGRRERQKTNPETTWAKTTVRRGPLYLKKSGWRSYRVGSRQGMCTVNARAGNGSLAGWVGSTSLSRDSGGHRRWDAILKLPFSVVKTGHHDLGQVFRPA